MTTTDELYNLLPAVYRLRDAEQGGALRELLALIAEQFDHVDGDIARLYDNWFIETADEWVVPYIGDLIGVRGLHPVSLAGFTQRARVANTLAYRRRKGTATMLEQLARDTTLWGARVVEFFKLLATTQYYNHIRLSSPVTPDLRQVDRLDLLDTPFDSLAHSADVRRIAAGRGKHNIPNIGIFLWRLQNYALAGADPRPADPASPDGRYFFASLGNDTPLYNQPRSEATISHLAEEVDVPAPVRPLAFYLDLEAYQRETITRDASRRPLRSQYAGPGASLDVRVDGSSLSPLQYMCMDLSAWARPPARVRGLRSGALPGTITLSAPLSATTPAVQVQIGAEGPFTAVLGSAPATPAQAAAALEAAVRAAQPGSLAFQNARVLAVDDRLFVLPGLPGLAVSLAGAAADATTAGELGLTAPPAAALDAALSTRLKPFPAMANRRMRLAIGALGPFLVEMSAPPVSLADARQKLEDAIRAANAAPEFQGAAVRVVDDCLLVLPGGGGGLLTFSEAPNDPATVHLLGLANRVAVDVSRGRLAFALGESPTDVRVRYNYGFSGDLGGGPYDRRILRQPGEAELSLYENSVAAYQQFDQVILVPSAGIASLTDALAAWDRSQRQAVIQIGDSRSYTEDLAIAMGSGDLVIQAANHQRPTLIGNLTISGNGGARLALNGLLIGGSVTVQDDDSLSQLDLLHCTLTPGLRLGADGQALQPRSPSLAARATNTRLAVNLRHSICGPVVLPADCAGVDAVNSILDSPLRAQPAEVLPALCSGALPANPNLNGPRPTLLVSIGNEGPYRVRLGSLPATRAAARDALETALRQAHDSPAFRQARVLLQGNRLVLLPGIAAALRAQAFQADDTAARLRLIAPHTSERFALLSGPIGTLPPAAATPALVVFAGSAQHTLNLAAPLNDLAQARQSLEAALQGADAAAPVFAQAQVLADTAGRRLVVLPGAADAVLQFAPAPGDATTLDDLALQTELFALAGSPMGERPGPPAHLESTTVLGRTHVKELVYASECLFTGMVISDRRQGRSQQDCVRFSFVPFGSRTPQRYRCQPDLAIAAAAAREEERLRRKLTASERGLLRQQVVERLTPSFTSTQYGEAAYAQLGPACPDEIRTGAADGAEMGAFRFLKQPQREANLQASLDEYLRFGLEAGFFYVS